MIFKRLKMEKGRKCLVPRRLKLGGNFLFYLDNEKSPSIGRKPDKWTRKLKRLAHKLACKGCGKLLP
jgi:hypothetical protein